MLPARLLWFSLLTLFLLPAKASVPIIIESKSAHYYVEGLYMEYVEDRQGELTIEDVSSPAYASKYIQGKKGEIAHNKNTASTYWIRFTYINNSKEQIHLLFELLDFRIEYMEVYFPDDRGGYTVRKAGALYPFDHKDYKHKNFIFDIPPAGNQPQTVYYKLKSEVPVSTIAKISSNQEEFDYANTEYFLLALFYGIIVAMILYNSFLFIALADKAYFFYVLYVTSIGFFALSQDGLGFQYIWYNYPGLNEYIFPISNYFMIVWALFYARSFLNTEEKFPVLDKGIKIMIGLKSFFFIMWFFAPKIAYRSWLDLIPLFYLYLSGITAWLSGYKTARFYVIAFTLFFTGFCVAVLQQLELIANNLFTVYSINLGVFGEMIMLSLALADRIKLLQYAKEKAQRQMIEQYEEKEMLKDKLNSELEKKVKERTMELELKSKELDNYLYRSSHDIKGPIKSIIGLTTIGMKDIEDPNSKNYFEHILKSSKRLDSVIDHLLMIMKVKELKLKPVNISFKKLIYEIIASLEHMPGSYNMKYDMRITQDEEFRSDEQLLYSIMQNLIENAIKYRDTNKFENFLRIEIRQIGNYAYLEFTDNGIGLDPGAKEKIFNMYYKSNPDSPGSGMGLYLTKTSAQKLGGSIEFESEEGTGTTFRVQLKNLKEEKSAVSAEDARKLQDEQ